MREDVLVVGLGEVGVSLFELFRESGRFNVYGYDVDKEKMRKVGCEVIPGKVDVMHICYPCTEEEGFVKVTVEYVNRFKPRLTIIESTVPPGTTWNVYKSTKGPLAHSPIRGIHLSVENMKRELKSWTKYVGGVDSESTNLARVHFEKIGLKVEVLKSHRETELAKLFNTTYRALMIAWFQEMHRISRAFRADFDEIVGFLEDTHRIRLDRPIFFPSVIGGHCLIPNARLLLESYNSKLVESILESNEKRKDEIRDVDVLGEVEKVRRRVENLNKDLNIEKASFNPAD